CLALEALHWLAQIVEQHQGNRRSGPRGPGTDATRSLEIDQWRPARRTELDPRIHRRGAARAVRSGTGSRESAAAVRAERLQPPGPTAAEGARDRFTLLAGDRRARDGARARQGRAPRRRLPPTPPPPPGDASAVLRSVNSPMGLPQSMQNCAPGSFARPQ